jgi:hypothetical protein
VLRLFTFDADGLSPGELKTPFNDFKNNDYISQKVDQIIIVLHVKVYIPF